MSKAFLTSETEHFHAGEGGWAGLYVTHGGQCPIEECTVVFVYLGPSDS